MDQTPIEVPDELRSLGELRQVFATTAGAVAVSVFRSLVPLALGCGLFAAALYWIVDHNWKFYLAVVLGTLLALQGVRLLIRTMFRLRQKVMIFEKGLAIWRSGQLAAYRWDQVDQVEATIAQAEGAATSFLSFSFVGLTDEGDIRSYYFHPAGDPIPNLKGLWKIIEEGAGRDRTANVIAAMNAGEEVTFQRAIWGKVVSTQIGLSLFGIRAKPRYEDSRFLDWSRVESIAVIEKSTGPQGYSSGGISQIEVVKRFDSDEPWLCELTSEIPGYQALVEAAEFVRRRYAETAVELHRERLPAALALIEAGQEFSLGSFGITKNGFRYESETHSWDDLGYLQFDKEAVAAPTRNQTFAYGSLTLADRWLLQMVELDAHYGDEVPDDEEKDEENDDK